ncbi:GAF domain-containing protein [bacterium]|nr:GAF domain-containing protein [bacterium]
MKYSENPRFDLKSYKAISQAISTYEDLQLLFQHLVEGICRSFKIKGSSILLYDENEEQLFRVSSHGLSDEYLHKGVIYMDDEYQEFLKGRVIVVDDLTKDSRVQYVKAATDEGIVAIHSIPIWSKNTIIGILKNYHSNSIVPHEEDLDSMSVLMHQLGLVIELNGLRNLVSSVKSAMESLPSHLLSGM